MNALRSDQPTDAGLGDFGNSFRAVVPSVASVHSHLLKYARAQEHFEALRPRMEAYLPTAGEDRNLLPYEFVAHRNDHTGEHELSFTIRRTPPQELSVLIGDCLFNLRCTLDHLLWNITMTILGIDSKTCQFPIVSSFDQYEKTSKRMIKDVPSEILGLLKRLQPFDSANGPVRTNPMLLLNELNNRDKHRSLNIAILEFQEIELDVQRLNNIKHQIRYRKLRRVKPDEVFARVFIENVDPTRDASLYFGYRANVHVAFGTDDLAEGLPVMRTLNRIIQRVGEVIAAFERYF